VHATTTQIPQHWVEAKHILAPDKPGDLSHSNQRNNAWLSVSASGGAAYASAGPEKAFSAIRGGRQSYGYWYAIFDPFDHAFL